MAKEVENTEVSQEVILTIHDVEDNAVIVNVDGWRMRVYFDEGVTNEKYHYGKEVTVNYFGDLSDVHTLKFSKLK